MSARLEEAAAAPSVLCPHCGGVGSNPALIDTAQGGYFDPALRCSQCKGEGRISQQQARWIEEGKALRGERVERQESLRDMGRRLGMSPADLSAMEHGRADPEPLRVAIAKASVA